jgi:hypothetical protein
MLRFLFISVFALCLAGCESGADFWQPVDDAWPFSDSQAAVPAVATADNAHCAALAYERAADAKANGYDDELREAVYSGTYAECAAWDRQHAPSQPN